MHLRKLTIDVFYLCQNIVVPARCLCITLVSSFGEMWRKLIYSFTTHLLNCDNSLVLNILTIVMYESVIFKHWNNVLYTLLRVLLILLVYIFNIFYIVQFYMDLLSEIKTSIHPSIAVCDKVLCGEKPQGGIYVHIYIMYM